MYAKMIGNKISVQNPYKKTFKKNSYRRKVPLTAE